MIKASGRKVFIGGNLGVPLIAAVSDDWDWGVVEISSFQLEWIEKFRPRMAALLNISEDHLDRYATFADYCHAKERIFEAQTSDDSRGYRDRHQTCLTKTELPIIPDRHTGPPRRAGT